MPLSDAEYTELQTILQGLEGVSMYASANGFVADQIEREKQYGQDIRVSPKQWAWLRRLRDEFAPASRPPAAGRVVGMTDDELDDEIPF